MSYMPMVAVVVSLAVIVCGVWSWSKLPRDAEHYVRKVLAKSYGLPKSCIDLDLELDSEDARALNQLVAKELGLKVSFRTGIPAKNAVTALQRLLDLRA